MRTADSLHRITNCLLDVSRLEEGQMPITRSWCDLGALATQVCHEMSALAFDRKLICDAQPVRIRCDEELIGRVLSNLISNGFKHTAIRGELHVTVTARAAGARVAVQDEGPGVPAEVRPRLFEKFAAVSLRKEREYHSVGLGLAFCKLAVQAHGGAIGVDSAPGGGSIFWFDLPGQ